MLRAGLTTKGDIFVATGAGILTRLPVGAADTFLGADAAEATGLKWVEIPEGGLTDHGALTGLGDDDHPHYTLRATLTTKGDIYGASAGSTPARLAVGANGRFLIAASGETTGLKWSPAAAVQFKTGEYTGAAASTKEITGVGFQPKVVMVYRQASSGSYSPVMKSDQDAGANAKDFNGGWGGTYIHSLEADGFIVGSADNVNTEDATYTYIAWG